MLRISAMPGMLWRRRLIVQSASARTSRGGMYPGSPSLIVERTPTSRISPMSEATGVMNGLHVFGQLLARRLQAFLHQHSGLVDVGVPAELGIDEREGDVGVGPQAREPGHTHERAFERLGDPRFDLLRSETRRPRSG
jgi:hypothetical protein